MFKDAVSRAPRGKGKGRRKKKEKARTCFYDLKVGRWLFLFLFFLCLIWANFGASFRSEEPSTPHFRGEEPFTPHIFIYFAIAIYQLRLPVFTWEILLPMAIRSIDILLSGLGRPPLACRPDGILRSREFMTTLWNGFSTFLQNHTWPH